MSVVEFRDVHFRIGDRNILNGLTLAIEPGETLVLLGRSGSGKTTALRLINGMHLPSSGEVRVDGKTTVEWDRVRLRRGIGYVIQEGGLFPHFTIQRNIGLIPRLEDWPEDKVIARVATLLSSVNLGFDDFAQRLPRELSGGQRQRVGVARALAADPKILLFDEPFGALDPVTRAELQHEFGALARRLGKTIVFVTHDIREALLLGQRIALLHNGRLVALAPPQEFLRLDHPE